MFFSFVYGLSRWKLFKIWTQLSFGLLSSQTAPYCLVWPKDKPNYIVNSLEDFLVPGAADKLKAEIEKARTDCANLGAKAKAKMKKKTEKQIKQLKKEAKKEMASLSQELVLRLVKTIEKEKMLKSGLLLQSTSSSSGMPTLVIRLHFIPAV